MNDDDRQTLRQRQRLARLADERFSDERFLVALAREVHARQGHEGAFEECGEEYCVRVRGRG